MEKKTALYDTCVAYGGKMVPFAGYLLPVQYPNGIIHEHQVVREKVGLFDVSHMGEVVLKGEDALANLNHLLTNNYTSLLVGKARYGIMCYENGTAVDDLLVYHLGEDCYLLVVNASNEEKDYQWIKDHIFGKVTLENISSQVSQLALQGPLAIKVMEKLTSDIPQKNYSFVDGVDIQGIKVLLSRTGYTGEDGFELYCKNEEVAKLWEILMETGKEEGIEPCGLGARDTLRLEAAMPLYGHELTDEITPKEANLDFFIKYDKDFIGKEYLLEEAKRVRIGLEVVDKGIAREGYEVYVGEEVVGKVTSGTKTPTVSKAIAMALVDDKYKEETEFLIDVRGKKLKAQQVELPFYSRKKK